MFLCQVILSVSFYGKNLFQSVNYYIILPLKKAKLVQTLQSFAFIIVGKLASKHFFQDYKRGFKNQPLQSQSALPPGPCCLFMSSPHRSRCTQKVRQQQGPGGVAACDWRVCKTLQRPASKVQLNPVHPIWLMAEDNQVPSFQGHAFFKFGDILLKYITAYFYLCFFHSSLS